MWEVAGILAVASFVSAHSLGDCWSCYHCHYRLFILFKRLAVVIMMMTIMAAVVVMVVMVLCGVRCQGEGIQFLTPGPRIAGEFRVL